MAMNYIVKNFKERLYTIIIYFRKGENNEKLFNFLKSELKEEGGTWLDNKYSFMSKETLFVLQKKFKPLFENIINSGEYNSFLNYKIIFKNPNNITLFTILNQQYDIDLFINELNEFFNKQIKNIPNHIKDSFKIKDKTNFLILSFKLYGNKLLINIDKELYFILNISFAYNNGLFNLTKKEQNEKLVKYSFIYSYLFSFCFKEKEFLFKEFLNICKICKKNHLNFENKICQPICVPCAVVKKPCHICGVPKSFCGLCKIYYDKTLGHHPMDNNCLHKKNIKEELFIKRRQNTLIKILKTPIIEDEKHEVENNETKLFDTCMENFPELK